MHCCDSPANLVHLEKPSVALLYRALFYCGTGSIDCKRPVICVEVSSLTADSGGSKVCAYASVLVLLFVFLWGWVWAVDVDFLGKWGHFGCHFEMGCEWVRASMRACLCALCISFVCALSLTQISTLPLWSPFLLNQSMSCIFIFLKESRQSTHLTFFPAHLCFIDFLWGGGGGQTAE